uniref:Ubiquinol-cytochrome C reductase hinge domain-containing protein n=1 Tax=Tetranychus urticae TaxID=32264 RepID=T1KWV3_TETUR
MFKFVPSLRSMIRTNVKERITVHAEEPEEEEELVDPLDTLRDKCKPHCKELQAKMDTCNIRVRSKKETTESCWEEMMDWMHCIDHCASKDLFKYLK